MRVRVVACEVGDYDQECGVITDLRTLDPATKITVRLDRHRTDQRAWFYSNELEPETKWYEAEQWHIVNVGDRVEIVNCSSLNYYDNLKGTVVNLYKDRADVQLDGNRKGKYHWFKYKELRVIGWNK